MLQTQLLKGALDLAILAAVGAEHSYGYEIRQRLVDAGLVGVSDAAVYGALKRLEANGDLRSFMVESPSGPPRRYFARTPQGAGAYRSAGTTWRRFADAIDTLVGGES